MSVVERDRTDARTPDPEALIKEARRRTRRRRARWALSAAVLAGFCVWLVVGTAGGDRARPRAVVRGGGPRPIVNARAFAGQGELAFVSRGRVWVLDGDGRPTLHALPLPRGLTAFSPTFSHDGRWIAWVAGRGSPTYSASGDELWLARANGGGAHAVHGLDVEQSIGWSGSSDVVAVVVEQRLHFSVGWREQATTLDAVKPSGSVRALYTVPLSAAKRNDTIWGAVWSPDGRQVAVSTNSYAAGTVITAVSLARPERMVRWYAIASSQRLAGICSTCGGDGVIADPAGWWRGWGIGFWVYSSGAVRDPDATPLGVIARPGARVRIIGQTLSSGITDAVAAGPNAALAIVASTENGGRQLALGKRVEVCRPTGGACTRLAGDSVWRGAGIQPCPCGIGPRRGHPGSAVSLDPSWSPDGDQLAYVRAPVDLATAWPNGVWYRDHVLEVWNARTGVSRRLPETSGAELPRWSRSGRELLYTANDGLWLIPAAGGRPVEIAHPLFPPVQWRAVATHAGLAFYGQIPWGAQFAWSSP